MTKRTVKGKTYHIHKVKKTRIQKELHDRILAGASFLNVINPGWWKKIDLAELDLADSGQCVLGQVYGDFDDAEVEIGLADSSYGSYEAHKVSVGNKEIDQSEALGFYLEDEKGYKSLTNGWKAFIKKLKRA